MFTIIQKQQDNSFNVLAKVIDEDVARELAGTLCNKAGVARTLVLDEYGYAIAGES